MKKGNDVPKFNMLTKTEPIPLFVEAKSQKKKSQ